MSVVRRKYDVEFKKNAVKLSDASSKTIAEVAWESGISDGMLHHRRLKYTPNGDKTRFATLEEENKALRLKTAEQAIEIDMFKKASAYFASLHKESIDSATNIKNTRWWSGRNTLRYQRADITHMAWKIIWTKGQERWLRQVGKADLRIGAKGIWSRGNLWNHSKKRIPGKSQKGQAQYEWTKSVFCASSIPTMSDWQS